MEYGQVVFGFFGLDFRASGPNAGRVAERGERFADLFGVVARVQTQALLATGGPMGVAGGFGGGRQARQGAVCHLHVVPVGPVGHQARRNAPGLRQPAALGAAVAAVRGVGARFFPPSGALCSKPSSAIQSKSSPIKSS